MEQNNPFSDYGTTICGDRFIGRQAEINEIHNRLFGDVGYGSLAVVGLPRMGKTSLLAEAVRQAHLKIEKVRAVVVRMDAGVCQSADDLFQSLIIELWEGIQSKEMSNEAIDSQASRVLNQPDLSFFFVRSFFYQIRKAGIRAVCILDEFDASRYLFEGKQQYFHWLRELCSNPEFKAAFVLIGKRRLQDVARIAGHDKNYWANVLGTMTLRPFTPEEYDIFLERLAIRGVEVSPEVLAEIAAVCSQHPYLLDVYAYHAWNQQWQGRSMGVEWFRTTMQSVLRDYYDQVITILRDTSILGKFIQIVLGPQWNVSPDDVDAMNEYGLIRIESGTRLRSFSQGFEDYVRFIDEGSVEIWPLWRDTERALRNSIETQLQYHYGEEWSAALERKYSPNLGKLIKNCKEKMAKDRERFGSRTPSSLLAYTYPSELFQIMAADWPALGEPLLGADKQGWSRKLNFLAKIRTPLAHNREEAINDGLRLQAEGICREIIDLLKPRLR